MELVRKKEDYQYGKEYSYGFQDGYEQAIKEQLKQKP